MSNDLNQCNFIGRLGKDPETRFMASGDAVTSFSLAVGSQWKDKNQEKQESTEWVNCTAFGKLAEIIAQYVKKGSQIFISGRLKTDKYTDKQGVEKYSTKIIVDQMQMLGGKGDSQPRQPQEKQFTGGAATGAPKGDFSDMDDDIPFVFNTLYDNSDCVSKSYLRARRGR